MQHHHTGYSKTRRKQWPVKLGVAVVIIMAAGAWLSLHEPAFTPNHVDKPLPAERFLKPQAAPVTPANAPKS